MELLRPRRDQREPRELPSDAEPRNSIQDIWAPAARVATVGIFVLLLGATLYVCRPILLPVVAALVIGTTFAPLVKGVARHGIPPWVTAVVLGMGLLAFVGAAVTLLAAPVGEWIAMAPEIGSVIRQKLYILDQPLGGLARAAREDHAVGRGFRSS